MKSLLAIVLILAAAVCASAQTTTFNGVVKDLTNTPVATGNVTFTIKPGIDTTISGNARFTPTSTACVLTNAAVVSTTGTTTITVTVTPTQPWQIGDSIIFTGTGDSTLNANTVAVPYVITGGALGTVFTFAQAGTHTNGAGGTVGGIYSPTGTGPCAVIQNTALTVAFTSYRVDIQPSGTTTSSFNTYAIGSGPVDISTIVPTPSEQPSYSFVDLFTPQTITGQKTFTNSLNSWVGGTFSGNPNFTGTPTFSGGISSTLFTASTGFVGPYFKSSSPSVATTGLIRAANGDLICFGVANLCFTNTAWFLLDFPDYKIVKAANCTAGTPAAGWSAPTGFSAACRAGSNNLDGMLQCIPSSGCTAQIMLELPMDWDSTAQPYISIIYASGANTTGTVIWTVASACTKQDGSVTDDPGFNAESAFGAQTMANANATWGKHGQFTAITSINNCIPGSQVSMKLTLSGTAGSNINVYQAVVTIPRAPVVQAE